MNIEFSEAEHLQIFQFILKAISCSKREIQDSDSVRFLLRAKIPCYSLIEVNQKSKAVKGG